MVRSGTRYYGYHCGSDIVVISVGQILWLSVMATYKLYGNLNNATKYHKHHSIFKSFSVLFHIYL